MEYFADMNTIDDVVTAINNLNDTGSFIYSNGYYTETVENFIAQWILLDSEEFIIQSGTDYIEEMLDYLVENGASFDYEKAYQETVKQAFDQGLIEPIVS